MAEFIDYKIGPVAKYNFEKTGQKKLARTIQTVVPANFFNAQISCSGLKIAFLRQAQMNFGDIMSHSMFSWILLFV